MAISYRRTNVPYIPRTTPAPPRRPLATPTAPWGDAEDALLQKIWGTATVHAISKSMRRCYRTVKARAKGLGLV